MESKWCEDVKVEVKEDAKVESKWCEYVKVEMKEDAKWRVSGVSM